MILLIDISNLFYVYFLEMILVNISFINDKIFHFCQYLDIICLIIKKLKEMVQFLL